MAHSMDMEDGDELGAFHLDVEGDGFLASKSLQEPHTHSKQRSNSNDC